LPTIWQGERGGETVFSGVDFRSATGEALVVTGPNGAGKSTLLRVSPACCRRQRARRLEGGGEDFPTLVRPPLSRPPQRDEDRR
jgi:heme exporter protein A